ncbi:Gfo/Idh/MocA family protein [Spiroplasma chrysopicola]|uniref:Uncharacterized protein n=1 Tax=Spiroplasma chrysopicola DF-1 TaxID=1276227 RepID=R4UH68_9MOLU|nr:Gfo/Idh/MocA family oxidoreductase [Spiroplasma chrysopicola]AGM24666.1 hypothetical protein SCHRY_v1c00790 [Spiroplasma chrysopicola DF-1]
MRIVCIGAGRIVKWFCEDLAFSKYRDKIKLYGIYNRTKQKAEIYQENYQFEIVYEDLTAVIADKNNYDLVYVGTSDETHYQIAKLLLSAQIPVFCEKPLALSYHEAQELYQIAQDQQVLLFDGIKTGFSPAYQAMKADIQAGLIGKVQYLRASHAKISTSGQIPNPQSNDQNFAGLHLAGGVYALFIGLDILGPIKTTMHLNNSYPNHPAISTSVLTNRHQNNGISTIIASDSLTSDLSAEILGTKGYIKLGGNLAKYNQDYRKDSCHMAYTYQVYDTNGNILKNVDLPLTTKGEGLFLEIDHLYELWINKQLASPIVPPTISLAIIEILAKTNNTNDYEVVAIKGGKSE